METAWELTEGGESYGSLRGGLGREKARFHVRVVRAGLYHFCCSLPAALNAASGALLRLSKSRLLRRLVGGDERRGTLAVRLRVLTTWTELFREEFTLGLDSAGGAANEAFHCFEVFPGWLPVQVEVELEGFSFSAKLHPAASLHLYGGRAPETAAEKTACARFGRFLLARSLLAGRGDFEQAVGKARQELAVDTSDPGFLADTAPAKSPRSPASPHGADALRAPGAVVYEVKSSDAIGDAMFFLLDKGKLSAPVWDEAEEKYLGLFDMNDALSLTLSLREELKRGRARSGGGGSFEVLGVRLDDSERTASCGLDLPVRVLFRDGPNARLAVWRPMTLSSPMRGVIEALGSDAPRVPVLDPAGRVVKVLSQSEIISVVFLRYIQPKLEPNKRDYFLRTELNYVAAERGVLKLTMADPVMAAFTAIVTSKKTDAVAVVDERGAFAASITQLDAWFLCKAELDEGSISMDAAHVSIADFIKVADRIAANNLTRKRRSPVLVSLDTPLGETISKIVRHHTHGAYVCDAASRPLGRITVADIVRALLADDVGIFKVGEDVASVFLWDERSRLPSRPTVQSAVSMAAERSRKRREEAEGQQKQQQASNRAETASLPPPQPLSAVARQTSRSSTQSPQSNEGEPPSAISRQSSRGSAAQSRQQGSQGDSISRQNSRGSTALSRQSGSTALSRQSSRGSAASLRSAGLAAPAVHDKAADTTAAAAVASLPVAGELRALALVAEPWRQQMLPQPTAQELKRLYVVPKSGKLKSLLLPDRQWALDKVLPERLRGGKWEQVFSMQGHGASSLAVRQALGGAEQPLVLALEDASGFQFGGFLPSGLFMDASSLQNGYNEGPLGDGESFVFSFGHKGSPSLRTFGWTGKNRLFRILSLSRGVGMGGGGQGFAWLVDDCLATGCSMRSDTYDNPCLAGSEDFRCVDLAAYRIKSGVRDTSTSN